MASFSVWLRGCGLLGLSSLVFGIFYAAGRPLINVHQNLAPASKNAHWAEISLTWFPLVMLLSLLIMVIAAATIRGGG